MKKKTILLSILSIVMCLSLVMGGTFALFTSKSEVNVAVTSGTVNVTAEVNTLKYKTLTKDWTDFADGETSTNFDNLGGSATVNGGEVVLDKIVPGDGLSFNVDVINNSDVKVKYRTVVKNAEDSNADLFNALDVTINGAKYSGLALTTWEELEASTNGQVVETISVKVELPKDASGENLMGKTCKFVVTVEAVQGNAETHDETYDETEIGNTLKDGGEVALGVDYSYGGKFKNDTIIHLNDKTFEATGTLEASANLTMKNGNYEVNGTYGHVDARPNATNKEITLYYENVNFSFNQLNKTYGPSTNRLGSVLEVCATVADAVTNVTFKDCIFDNASVLIEGLSGVVGKTVITFDGCIFNALTSSAPISVQNYVDVDLTVKNCTFNIEATSNTASGISVSSSSSTKAVVKLENNTFNASAATPYTYDPSKGETEAHNVKVNGTIYTGPRPEGGSYVKLISSSDNTVIIENGVASASTSTALDSAINAGASTVQLGEGNYVIPDSAQGKALTIVGDKNNPEKTKIATQDDGSYEGCDYSLDGATVTFEGITINTDSATYTGYARLKATYNNCIINGTFTLYDNSTFNNCTFNVSGDVYNIWTWGAPEATFNGCTFNSDGKALLLYGGVNTKLTVDGCTFNDKGGLTDLKAAIEIGNDYGTSYELIVNNTTVNGYEINDKGINTNTTLWANKNSMGTDKLNVVVNGVDVY